MPSFSVSTRGAEAIEVEGANWVVALGLGLERLGQVDALARLACEVLPNGTVIARDVSSGTGYIVQPVFDPILAREESALRPLGLDDDAGSMERLQSLPPDALTMIPDGPEELIAQAPTVGKACNLALTYAREEVPAESGAVILQEGSYLRFAAVVGPVARRLRGARLPLGAGVAGYALETRREVVLLDARRDPRHCGEVDALTGYVTRQILVVPVIHGRKALGVIELMNRQRGDAFSSEDAQLVAGIARVLAERLAR